MVESLVLFRLTISRGSVNGSGYQIHGNLFLPFQFTALKYVKKMTSLIYTNFIGLTQSRPVYRLPPKYNFPLLSPNVVTGIDLRKCGFL